MMDSIKGIKQCTGCAGCFYACPRNAITMCKNEKGFLHPLISEEECIHCGVCLRACHLQNDDEFYTQPLLVLAAKNKSDEERKKSSSGGVFLLLAKRVLQENGVVYGAAFDEKNIVRHIRATTLDSVERCCQSKYVQSDAVDSFQWAFHDVAEGKTVLFVGTPCQISAFRTALKLHHLNEDNVLLVDFVCHGTPSPRVFNDYLSMIEEKYSGHIKRFSFRDKSQGWRGNGYKVEFTNGKSVVNGFYLRGYNKLFPLSTNDACFDCLYSKPERVSDITLGDFWGIESTSICEFEDELGVSMVMANTKKGKRWITYIDGEMEYMMANVDFCKGNTPLFHAPRKNSGYDLFWYKYFTKGYRVTFDMFCKFKGKKGMYERIKWIIMYKFNMKNIIFAIYQKGNKKDHE